MTGPHAPLGVEVRGSGRGAEVETFLLLHGYGASSFTWRHWMPALEHRGRVLLVDMKGFGSAEKPDDGRYTPEVQAELVTDTVEREAPARLTLVGHSLGGGVALLTALRLADRGLTCLRRMVVLAGAAYEQKLPPVVALAQHPRLTRLGVRALGHERVIRWVLRSIVYRPDAVDDEQVRAYAEPYGSPEGLRAALDAARQIVPEGLDRISTRYPEISVPALLIWGRQDRVVPLRIGERLAEALPDARLEVLEACGHIPHEEEPAATLALLEAFLSRS